MDKNFLFAIAQDEEREGSIPKADILAGIRTMTLSLPELSIHRYNRQTQEENRAASDG